MKLFSQKNINTVIALFAVLTTVSCGREPMEPIVYNVAQQVPEIQSVTETYAASVNENTAEQILKKEDEKQIQEEKKQEKLATVENKTSTPTTVTSGNQVTASSIFKKDPVYSGPASLSPDVKKYTLALKRDPAFINRTLFEPSALCFDDKGALYTVADKLHYSIYKLDLSNPSEGYDANADIKLNTKQMLKLRLKKKNKFDFEGLAFHKGEFYAADERDRNVFKIDREGNMTKLDIDINGYMKSKGIRNDVENSGLEGLTIDSEHEMMYLMKERQESEILAVDMKTNKVVNHFKVALPGNVEPTLTDASFYNGHLYVLLRSHRQVLKMNPENGAILSIYDYRKYEEDPKNVYVKIPTFGSGNDPQGYGVMEGLAVTKDAIYIATDNNMLPLKRNILNNKPQLFIFSNPE